MDSNREYSGKGRSLENHRTDDLFYVKTDLE